MANSKVAKDFDQMIQEGRQRKKNEELAKQIFGKSRPGDISGRKDTKPRTSTPSLASRIGISKRSSSAPRTASPRNVPSRPSSSTAHHNRQDRLATEIQNDQQVNLTTSKPTGSELRIKGSAAPFVVEARNFAQGTSEADISSAIERALNDSSALVSCRIVSTKPTVVAEMVFNDRSIADNIIATYNHQIADGQKLEVRLARSGPGSMSRHHHKASKPQPAAATAAPPASSDEVDAMEDVEVEQEVAGDNLYNQEREAAERGRRDKESRRDKDGYDSSRHRSESERDPDQQERRDNGERDRRRARGYERSDREERPAYQRGEESNGGRGSHYGNGVGGTPRAQYGGGYAGGRGSYPGYGGYGGRGYRSGYRGYR